MILRLDGVTQVVVEEVGVRYAHACAGGGESGFSLAGVFGAADQVAQFIQNLEFTPVYLPSRTL